MCARAHVYVYVYVYVYIYIYMCVCACVYVYIYIYAYMHVYIHACKHAHNASARRRPVTFRCNRSPSARALCARIPPCVRIVRADSAHDFGTTLIEYFGSPSLELRNGVRISILELKWWDNSRHNSHLRWISVTWYLMVLEGIGVKHQLVPPLLSTSVHLCWSSEMAYVSAFWS